MKTVVITGSTRGLGFEMAKKFDCFRDLLKELFPVLFNNCTIYNFRNGIVLRWAGGGTK